MAYSPEDLLGTPSGYASPEQLASVQQYAALLSKGGLRDKEITSPWQGVRMMADALSGGVMRNRAGQMGQQNRDLDASGVMGAAQPPGSMATLDQPSAPAHAPPTQMASLGGVDPQTARTFKLESGGNPAAVTGSNRGLAQFSPDLEKKYGVTNWQDPAQEAAALRKETTENAQGLAHSLGRQPTPGEIYLAHQQGLAGATALLSNPNVPAWQAVRKFYPSDAVAQKAIAGNPPGGGHFDPNAPAGAFASAWVKQFESRMPKGGGGQTADLSGGIGGAGASPPGSPAAMSGLLAANTGAGSAEPPMAKSGDPTFGAQYAPSRPQVNPQKLQQLLSSPTLDPAMKQQLYQQYMMQNQPVEAAGPGGRWVIPSGGGKPLWIPELQKGDLDVGGIKVPYMGTVGQDQGGLQYKGVQGVPGVSNTPQGSPPDFSGLPDMHGQPEAPPQAPPGGPDLTKLPDMHGTGPRSSLEPPATAAGQASPMGQMAEAGAAQPQAGAAPGIKTASLGNGSVQSDTPPIGGMLGSPPPQMPSQPESGPQVAQASGGLPSIENLRDFKLNMDKQGELNKEDVKKYTENSNALLQAGTQAQQGLPMLKLAQQAVKDPKYYSGFGANAVLNWKQLKAAVGDDPNAAAAMEVFEKSMAGDVLGQLRSKLQGLGQVRLAEIDLLTRSTANKFNTPAANAAVLNIIERGYNQMGAISQITDAYSGGARLDAKGNWVKGNDQPSNAGLNEVVRKYLSLHPTFSQQEIKDLNKTLDLEDKKPDQVTYTNSKSGQPVQPGQQAAPAQEPDHLQMLLDERNRRQGK